MNLHLGWHHYHSRSYDEASRARESADTFERPHDCRGKHRASLCDFGPNEESRGDHP
jgi:hypothetical protein